MKPILTVEFHARSSDQEFDEETIALRTTEELYRFVAPGGGCEAIPDRVGEIRFTFMPAADGEDRLAGLPATLQLGRVVVTGPLADDLVYFMPVKSNVPLRHEHGDEFSVSGSSISGGGHAGSRAG